MISIAICDDNEITTQEIAKKVEQYCPVETEFSIFHHPKDLLDSMYAKEKAYDIILMDTQFESASGIEAVKQINSCIRIPKLYILRIMLLIFLLFMKPLPSFIF